MKLAVALFGLRLLLFAGLPRLALGPVQRLLLGHRAVAGLGLLAAYGLLAVLALALARGVSRQMRWAQPAGLAYALLQIAGLVFFRAFGCIVLANAALGLAALVGLLSASGVGWFAPDLIDWTRREPTHESGAPEMEKEPTP